MKRAALSRALSGETGSAAIIPQPVDASNRQTGNCRRGNPCRQSSPQQHGTVCPFHGLRSQSPNQSLTLTCFPQLCIAETNFKARILRRVFRHESSSILAPRARLVPAERATRVVNWGGLIITVSEPLARVHPSPLALRSPRHESGSLIPLHPSCLISEYQLAGDYRGGWPLFDERGSARRNCR
ncbi:hypothetical protein Bbelb_122450 [Branchiostoma belcheri]|nr:hypothetical protein Bbelb_122450 [Branchiostoma belcheri]